MESRIAQQLNRHDRHVGRSYVRMSEGASQSRVAYSLEEALRLANLPGEDEGRIYCFRRVSLSAIPANANRRLWTEQIQQALTAVASRAVHGDLPNADSSDAIFFNSLEEALQMLLRSALRRGNIESVRPAWFASSLLGMEAGSAHSLKIPAILRHLRPPAIAPGAAAAILFTALSGYDAAALLNTIPSITIREWVRELEGKRTVEVDPAPLDLPEEMKIAIRQAAAHFGWRDPATVWLAAQAVICVSPASWSAGTSVKRARATLRVCGAERMSYPLSRVIPPRDAPIRLLVFDDEDANSATGRQSSPQSPAMLDSVGRSARLDQPAPLDQTSLFDRISDLQISEIDDAPMAGPREGSHTRMSPLLGEATNAAGLFFLLNALRRVGIVAALDACPALAESELVTHILMRLCACAGVADDDPILSCLSPAQESFVLPPDELAGHANEIWPRGFAAPHVGEFDSNYFVRAWVVAVERWCWRAGRIRVRDIVTRNGRVWRTRTDLDVTLPLSAVDIRIRRVGLDIDPGWLPWFGQYGCVVRFHY